MNRLREVSFELQNPTKTGAYFFNLIGVTK
jgi:hypothetical protein